MTKRELLFAAAFGVAGAAFWHVFWGYVSGSFSWEVELFRSANTGILLAPSVVRTLVALATTAWVVVAFGVGFSVGGSAK